jgi:hypothetical protein
MSGNDNPGNFANRPKEEVQEIASKGGQASHNSGFASMDPDKQVCQISHLQTVSSPHYISFVPNRVTLARDCLQGRPGFQRLI